MKVRYKMRDGRGERTIAEDRFPLIIAAGPTADIRVADLKTDEEVAYIGLSQKRPFVQVGPSDVVVQYNHRKLEDSAWLMHADLLEIGSCKINIKIEGNDFIIQVVSRQPTTETDRPPTAADTDAELKIKPLPFRPQRRGADCRFNPPLSAIHRAGNWPQFPFADYRRRVCLYRQTNHDPH